MKAEVAPPGHPLGVTLPASELPEILPLLSRGKHRNPRKGACFMELASYLAGERWSDHPRCTHPLLAALARLVNDCTTDAGRPMLAPLIPSVIGLTSDDPRVDARLAVRCAREAMPVVSAERQRVLAVSLLAADRALAHLDGRPVDTLEPATRAALDAVPDAERWARHFSSAMRTSVRAFQRYGAPAAVRSAIEGIALAGLANADDVLRRLLEGAIADCVEAVGRGSDVRVDQGEWAQACRLTGAVPRS